ncbi:MAG: PmoA family protein, partial [Parabacteroides sp.]|nr:PmoA family protein [Parabacteroides sp.]
DENANGGRGDVFVNFAPTKNKDWELQPNKKYKLRYRIFMYDGEMTKELADRLWNDYAYPPQVIVK